MGTRWNYESYIDGKWTQGSSGRTITVIDPATEEPIGEVPEASVADTRAALEAAHRAFTEGPWPFMKPKERGAKLKRLAEILDSRHAELRELIVAETAAERDALAVELAAAKAAFAEPAATIDNLQSEATGLKTQLDSAQSQVTELQEENASIQGMKEQYRGSVPLSWVSGAMLVCLIAGLLAGLWWADRSSRRRHGGIRIY